MKQTLRITKFVGRSENAMRIQIAVALIACLLLRILQKLTKETHGFLELVRLVATNIMHRKDLTQLRKPPPPPPLDSRRLQLCLSRTRTGQPWDKPGHPRDMRRGHCSSRRRAVRTVRYDGALAALFLRDGVSSSRHRKYVNGRVKPGEAVGEAGP
jgi:hypothetical protein